MHHLSGVLLLELILEFGRPIGARNLLGFRLSFILLEHVILSIGDAELFQVQLNSAMRSSGSAGNATGAPRFADKSMAIVKSRLR